MTRAPVISISHGGGPFPLLGDPAHDVLVNSLRTRVPDLLKLGTLQAPRGIVLITAHWSERYPTISNAKKHRLLYDYYGFPPESYEFQYNADGSPEIANEVASAMKEVGLEPAMDDERGWDHGVFVPMIIINPRASIPIVQLSVLESESPTDHYKMGQALSSLRDSNIAIVGSGLATFHNLRLMLSGTTSDPEFQKRNRAWSTAVTDAALETDPVMRQKKFESWREWPAAYEMHPGGGADHFLPLIVCAGAGADGKGESYADEFMGMDIYSYYWT